jgi:DNA polymerase-3 subunit beta
MKLTIQKTDLHRGLSRLQAVVEKRNSMPILANVLLSANGRGEQGRLELVATDLEVGVRDVHTVLVQEAGSTTVSARKLFDIVRELPDDAIELQATTDARLQIRSGRIHFSLAGTAAEEYPSLPVFSADRLVSLQAAILSTMIERTMYAASVDETRYN